MASEFRDYTVPFGAVMIATDEYRRLIEKVGELKAAQDRITLLEYRIERMKKEGGEECSSS